MNKLPIIQSKKIVKTTVRFSKKRTIGSMNTLALIHGKNIVETTVRFSIK